MSKDFMPELPITERIRLLRDNNDGFEETTYMKSLSQDDLDIKRERLSDNLIFIDQADEELQTAKDHHKIKTKPVKADNKKLISEIRTRKEEVIGTLYHVADQENGIMETFDENGGFVSSRRLRPEEKQLKAFPLSKAQ